ncbi:class I SAM-dependent methyltransferase [Campylobacter sp. RM16187]|uniref:class I SAM-dependent methyltransferase n=1 Tax=Campylobacter sp. RM16187 TaxID=1660063 RepID=UPI0021B6D27A|nr:class I SAM-dependent methyltransferase [Campylobacter sp. RM16187]QKG28446.1 SAM-dependent methyltransferase [Campylobacter sp. RM16187]
MKSSWDKKAANYSRYEGELNEFQRRFFNKLDEFGIDFNDKTLIDVGCGTGVYTLYLSNLCKNVTGLDLSTKMLECMREDADKFGVSNLRVVESSWDDFNEDNVYDIAFSTMSPAINSIEGLDKFIRTGKKRVFMWWNKQRHSSVLERFYKIYGERQWSERLPYFEYHLDMLKIPVKSHVFNEVRTRDISLEKMYEDMIWHLEIGNLKFNKQKVKDELLSICKDGKVTETVTSSMKLLVF